VITEGHAAFATWPLLMPATTGVYPERSRKLPHTFACSTIGAAGPMSGIEQFLQQNASAVFALLGAAGGGLLSFLGSWFLRKREYDLKLWEKLLEHRIRAHESVIQNALEMRVMVPLGGGIDVNGEILRCPNVLRSKEAFETWFHHAFGRTGAGSTWLCTSAKRELNYVQDYFATLYMHLRGIPSESYPQVGVIVRDDFIKLSSDLEREAFSFFESDIRRLKVGDLRSWHKHPLKETQRRLNETRLLQHAKDVAALARN
jgi:hypothetical protein